MQITVNSIFEWGHMVSKTDREMLAPALIDAHKRLTPEVQPPKELVVYQTPEDFLE